MAMFGSNKTSPEDVAALQAEVARLTAALADETTKRTAAEDAAKAAVDAQPGFVIMQRGIEEQPTGRKIMVPRCVRYDTVDHRDDGRPILKPKFEQVEVPTYYYKIDLPPSGGVEIKINGESFQHGEVYEFDLDQLRTIKDIVARSWGHEQTIHGNDENVFRKPSNMTLRGKRGARA